MRSPDCNGPKTLGGLDRHNRLTINHATRCGPQRIGNGYYRNHSIGSGSHGGDHTPVDGLGSKGTGTVVHKHDLNSTGNRRQTRPHRCRTGGSTADHLDNAANAGKERPGPFDPTLSDNDNHTVRDI